MGRIRKKYRVKRGRTSGKAEKALEEWWRSFIIGSKIIIIISLLKLSRLQHEQVNNSYNPEVATYQKHWHFFFFLCIFRLLSSLNMSCLIFSHLLQTYLRLTSILLDLPKFGRIVLCLSNFERSNFIISRFK